MSRPIPHTTVYLGPTLILDHGVFNDEDRLKVRFKIACLTTDESNRFYHCRPCLHLIVVVGKVFVSGG